VVRAAQLNNRKQSGWQTTWRAKAGIGENATRSFLAKYQLSALSFEWESTLCN